MDEFVIFLKEGIGVPVNDIFCSSIPGHGIRTGADFSEYIKKEILNPELVILLLTESYMESEFCLMELGACWATTKNTYPIIVTPVNFGHVTKTLGLIQGVKIEDFDWLNEIKELLQDCCELEKRTSKTWDDKRDKWKQNLPKLLESLPKATKIKREEFELKVAEEQELNKRVKVLELEVSEKDEFIEKLRKIKDAEDFNNVFNSFGGKNAKEKFEELIDNIKNEKSDKISRKVFEHIIYNYQGISADINWLEDKEEFEKAIQYKFIDGETFEVLWNGKLKTLKGLLNELNIFMTSEEAKVVEAEFDTKGIPFDSQDAEFWDQYL